MISFPKTQLNKMFSNATFYIINEGGKRGLRITFHNEEKSSFRIHVFLRVCLKWQPHVSKKKTWVQELCLSDENVRPPPKAGLRRYFYSYLNNQVTVHEIGFGAPGQNFHLGPQPLRQRTPSMVSILFCFYVFFEGGAQALGKLPPLPLSRWPCSFSFHGTI